MCRIDVLLCNDGVEGQTEVIDGFIPAVAGVDLGFVGSWGLGGVVLVEEEAEEVGEFHVERFLELGLHDGGLGLWFWGGGDGPWNMDHRVQWRLTISSAFG